MHSFFFKSILGILIFCKIAVAHAQTPTLFLVGDSTCSDYIAMEYPRTGWGTTISSYFDNNIVKFDNRAKSGRSSKSFYDEGSWAAVLYAIKSGDFVIIQFGHNDEKTDDPLRFTDPYTTYQEYLKKYIDEARSKGAYPILATSIYRNYWNNDGVTMKDSHGNYPPAMKALAIQENVPLVDAHVLSKALFESFEKSYTTNKIFLNLVAGEYPNYPSGRSDNTHLQENGANKLSKVIADSLSELSQIFSYLSVFANVLGLNEFNFINDMVDLKVTKGHITISSNTIIDHLTLNDLSGHLLFKSDNVLSLDINTESWNTGVYFINFGSAGKHISKKFIVSN